MKTDLPALVPKKRPKQRHFEWTDRGHDPVRGETALWVAVIAQAMMDVLSGAKGTDASYNKIEANHWLQRRSDDFNTVCALANCDPDWIRRKAKNAIDNPQPWRAEAQKGKRYEERKAYREKLKTFAVKNVLLLISSPGGQIQCVPQ